MKLVMTYDVGDGYTWSSEIVQPFEYESLEKAYCDFIVIFEDYQEKYKEARNSESYRYLNPDVKFAGFEINLSNFHQYEDGKDFWVEPQLQTLDEWFETNKAPSDYTLGLVK